MKHLPLVLLAVGAVECANTMKIEVAGRVSDNTEQSFEAYELEQGPLFRTSPKEFLIDPEGRVEAYGFPVFRDLASRLAPR